MGISGLGLLSALTATAQGTMVGVGVLGVRFFMKGNKYVGTETQGFGVCGLTFYGRDGRKFIVGAEPLGEANGPRWG